MLELKSITGKSFQDYGYVIERTEDTNFQIIASDSENPWRLALYRFTNKEAAELESHTYSMESFEPFEGVSVIVVAKPETPDEYEAFLLDRPVVLYKATWHQVITLGEETTVKITENYDVPTEKHQLKNALKVRLV